MKKIVLVLAAVLIAGSAHAEVLKKADLAGQWYPSSKEALSAELDGYLAAADVEPINGTIKAIIVPHAGLAYSGGVAAYGYKAVRNKGYSTVLLLGFCHRMSFDGISVFKEGSFETPLGPIEVDSEMASDIISKSGIAFYKPEAFANENSVEMELLFIKRALPGARIVPMAFGSREFSAARSMADVLSGIMKKRDDVLLVVSTDMSHYLSYETAGKVDMTSIEFLKDFDAQEIYDRSVRGEQLFCGYIPVATALLAAKKIGAGGIKILKYANSGDITGDRQRVVGYVSAAIYEDNGDSGSGADSEVVFEAYQDQGDKGEVKMEKSLLNTSQRKRLLEIAREAIRTYLESGKVPEVVEADETLNKEMGAFVTLHEDGRLRGCIGNIIGRGPLYLTVRDVAIEAATRDHRFSKVTPEELGKIDIEISVLSELEKVTDVDKIEMGVHGVLVRKGFASGVFLPQVATETGWSRDEYMSNLCAHKAGLMPDAWKTGGIDIYIFTAEVFGEK